MKGMSETVSTASNAADAWTNPLRDPRDLRLPRIAGPCSIVIFGVTGDLSRKKLLPAIYDLANRGLLPPSFGLTGFARRDWTEDHFKDFVKEYLKDKKKKLADIMVEATFVHPTYNIAKLFRRMQTAKIHMVIVVDEYGQTEGIVTMEDILEEIVGNILDEYDDASDDIKKRGDVYIVSGKAELDEVSDVLGIEFPDEDFQTMNGFLLYELGRLPYADEEIEIVYQNYKFTSLSVSNNMIGEVKITKVEKTQQ